MGSLQHARTYLDRDWALFEDANTEHQRALRASRGAGALVLLADELRRHAVACQPAWPELAVRKRDEAHHVRLIAILDRVGRQRP